VKGFRLPPEVRLPGPVAAAESWLTGQAEIPALFLSWFWLWGSIAAGNRAGPTTSPSPDLYNPAYGILAQNSIDVAPFLTHTGKKGNSFQLVMAT
jgi:hypothetical protein